MARVWCVCRYRRKAGSSNLADPPVFYLCLLSYNGVARYCIHDPCFLGKYEKLYFERQKKPLTLFVSTRSVILRYSHLINN